MTSFQESRARYESWLASQLGDDLVPENLAEKAELMRESAFVFLRGSYWRWAELAPELCPELMDATPVLSVGDIHLENFGTWRDDDGRLVWGVNDFDEAAEMPYALDLVRLAASALLGGDDRKNALTTISKALQSGYAAGLAEPKPIVLERDWDWLRADVVVPEERRAKFWRKMSALEESPPPERFRTVLDRAMPEPGLPMRTARRVAGTGSLGRPRWVGVVDWRGGDVVREAKALVTSAWSLARGAPPAPIRSGELAAGRYRAPDPWYAQVDDIVVRRLSPNNRKIEADKRGAFLLEPQMHETMGRELANIHCGTGNPREAIRADLSRRPQGWLADAATRVAAATQAEWKQFRKS